MDKYKQVTMKFKRDDLKNADLTAKLMSPAIAHMLDSTSSDEFLIVIAEYLNKPLTLEV